MRRDHGRIFYVYFLFRETGHIIWVGKGKHTRIDWCLGPFKKNSRINNVLKKTLQSLGDIPRLIIADGLTEKEAFDLEIHYICTIGRYPNGPLLNLTNGGEGTSGYIMGPDSRRLVSEAQKALPIERRRKSIDASHTPEAIAKTSATLTGHPVSDKTREKIRISLKNKPSIRKGVLISAETRRAIDAAPKSVGMSPENKAKLIAVNTGKKRSVECRAKISLAQKGREIPLGTLQSVIDSWNDPIKRTNRINALLASWADPVKREIRLEKARITREARLK